MRQHGISATHESHRCGISDVTPDLARGSEVAAKKLVRLLLGLMISLVEGQR